MKNFEQVVMLLKEYKTIYGNCLVPQSYTTKEGIHLGQIVNKIRTGARKISTEEKITLDNLGFVWRVRNSTVPFEEVIILLKEYKEKYGDCLVPHAYITKEGIYLGIIVSNIRTGARKISTEEKAMLDNVGFIWKDRSRSVPLEQVVMLLEEYKKIYGDCLVPHAYITNEGIHLGRMVKDIRTGARKTSAEEKAMLDTVGFVWKDRSRSVPLEQVVMLLEDYKKIHGNCLVPISYTNEDGIRLGMIVQSIRLGNRKISTEEKAMLDNVGFVWKVHSSPISIEQVVILLKEYKAQYGDCLVSREYITKNGVRLGRIVSTIRLGRKITTEEKEMLDSIGFVWKLRKGRID